MIKNQECLLRENVKNFRDQINSNFDLFNLNSSNSPISCFNYQIKDPSFRVNHFCMKRNDGAIKFDGLPDSIVKFIKKLIQYCEKEDLPYQDRYLFLTIDNKKNSIGSTQRDPGWHID
jgi:hypothetical protein